MLLQMNEDEIDDNLFHSQIGQATYNPCSETWTAIKCQAYTLVTEAYDKNLVSLLSESTFFTTMRKVLSIVMHKLMSRAYKKFHLAKHQLNARLQPSHWGLRQESGEPLPTRLFPFQLTWTTQTLVKSKFVMHKPVSEHITSFSLQSTSSVQAFVKFHLVMHHRVSAHNKSPCKAPAHFKHMSTSTFFCTCFCQKHMTSPPCALPACIKSIQQDPPCNVLADVS